DLPGGKVALDAGDADRAGTAAVAVAHRGADTEDALDVFLVVDGVAPLGDRVELAEQRLLVGDRVRRLAWHAGRGEHRPRRIAVERGEHRLADGRGVQVLALPEVDGEAHGAVGRVYARDHHRVRLVEHRDARGEQRLLRQLP